MTATNDNEKLSPAAAALIRALARRAAKEDHDKGQAVKEKAA